MRFARKDAFSPVLRLLLVLVLLFSSLAIPGSSVSGSPERDPEQQAAELLAQLTPQERIGQLFLITFKGSTAAEDSEIYDLVANHFIGGVLLLAENNNIAAEDTLRQVFELNRSLQQARWTASQKTAIDPSTSEEFQPSYIPLFIAIPQEGDGAPYDQIRSGVTPLPNEMALGATWNPDLSQQVGSVLGKELSSLGFNMLLGPSLDVLDSPNSDSGRDLGTRTFGGDPFWVGEMGKAYIQGIHEGSEGRLAVVADHFPGHGSADRLPEEEVATVRKSLEELRNFDLSPFFAVTGLGTDPLQTADALLTSHIRYQGFQGNNIRDFTRPVSIDPQALPQLMDLDPIRSWRTTGGVMISDNLGSLAMRRYYELNNQAFDPRRVAQNAFIAGNDLLFVGDLSTQTEDAYTATINTLTYFVQRYQEDPVFRQRVDDSVQRILTLKFRLYENFDLNKTLPPLSGLDAIGDGGQVTFDVARQAATLISPSYSDLIDTIPDPPNQIDRLVFITDTRPYQQCSTCAAEPAIGVRALQQMVLRRYGQQVNQNNLSSYSLQDLQSMLDKLPDSESPIEDDLIRAHWIIFSMLDSREDIPSFQTLKAFLSERPDLFQQKRVIVFVFNAPYYLDSTNISKIAAYYALYSRGPQFLDVATYLLFREISPNGAPPVSVDGVYDLNNSLFPDPDQVIPLVIDQPGQSSPDVTTTPEPVYDVGEVVPLKTGVIYDHNGHPVQDNTLVNFVISVPGEANSVQQPARTVDGYASANIQFTRSGEIQVRVETETAKQSEVVHFNVQQEMVNGVTVTSPPEPTATLQPTPTETPEPTPHITGIEPPPPPQTRFVDWLIALLVAAGIGWSVYRLFALSGQVRWGVRGGFLALIGGLAAYSYLALQMPGAEDWLDGSVARGVFLATLIGSGLGLLSAWLWRRVDLPGSDNGKQVQPGRES